MESNATANELITTALYMSGIVAREGEVPSDSQINDSLKQLNSILSQKQTDIALNPYYETYQFVGIIGQEDYFIPNLIKISTITYLFGDVRYPMKECGRDFYYGSTRINNIDTFPSLYFCEPKLGGATVYMYPFPDQAYQFEIHAKFRLQNITQFQDLTIVFDEVYRDYLMLTLAKRICIIQGFPVPDNLTILQRESESIIRGRMAPPDYRCKIKSTLSRGGRGGISNPALSQLYSGWIG
jgi:hypothetical protein